MLKAADAANVQEFVDGLSQGFDSQIGEQGVRLSGGQRQRIAIASAIYKDAPILVLDEAHLHWTRVLNGMCRKAVRH